MILKIMILHFPSTHKHRLVLILASSFRILISLLESTVVCRAVTATIEILQMQFLSPIFESSLLIELGFKYVSYRI